MQMVSCKIQAHGNLSSKQWLFNDVIHAECVDMDEAMFILSNLVQASQPEPALKPKGQHCGSLV
jgi:hypothetical protein